MYQSLLFKTSIPQPNLLEEALKGRHFDKRQALDFLCITYNAFIGSLFNLQTQVKCNQNLSLYVNPM